MRIAILGATSQIARDLAHLFDSSTTLYLFCRSKPIVSEWVEQQNLSCATYVFEYSEFLNKDYDVVINFVGSGNPAKTAALGADIFEITHKFDSLAIQYLESNPACKYIFFSSGAAFGAVFDKPLDKETIARVDLNHLNHQDWYGVAKLYAECRHRARPDLSIVDLRVYSYFSRTQDINARFLLSDVAKAIIKKQFLSISDDPMDRDYIHPSDLFQLIHLILVAPRLNCAIDCYSKAPISKMSLMNALRENYGLKIEINSRAGIVNATGLKEKYYSVDKKALTLGYNPQYDSLGGILAEMDLLLSEHKDA
jgi:nucleoside-diphosphate-sugar epimerase